MQGVVLFYMGDRIIHRQQIVLKAGDFANVVSDATEGFRRTVASFDLWDEQLSFKVLHANDIPDFAP